MSQASEGHLQDCLNRVNEELNNHAPYQKKRTDRYVGKIKSGPSKSVEFKLWKGGLEILNTPDI